MVVVRHQIEVCQAVSSAGEIGRGIVAGKELSRLATSRGMARRMLLLSLAEFLGFTREVNQSIC